MKPACRLGMLFLFAALCYGGDRTAHTVTIRVIRGNFMDCIQGAEVASHSESPPASSLILKWHFDIGTKNVTICRQSAAPGSPHLYIFLHNSATGRQGQVKIPRDAGVTEKGLSRPQPLSPGPTPSTGNEARYIITLTDRE